MLRLDVSACQALVVSQRWLEKVTEDGDCVVWTAAKDFDGYGKVGLDATGRRKSALLAQARRAVGLSHREYVAQYGQSQAVAQALIDAG